jgi:hypothetical protein
MFNLSTFSKWRDRKADEIFPSLDAMLEATTRRRDESRTSTALLGDFELSSDASDRLSIKSARERGAEVGLSPWVFDQVCGLAKAPAPFMRENPGELVAPLLTHRLQLPERRLATVQSLTRGGELMTALNGPRYQRIWDAEVIEGVMDNVNRSGRFEQPFLRNRVTKKDEPGGLYASDRDCFMFFVEREGEVEVSSRAKLRKGFFVWNSEVGSKSLGLATFMFNAVCANHVIMGLRDATFLRIRHTGDTYGRFKNDLLPMLNRFVETPVNYEKVRKAHEVSLKDFFQLPQPVLEMQESETPLSKNSFFRDFTQKEVNEGIEMALQEEGKLETVWDLVMGLTAAARECPLIEQRVEREKRAGLLLARL